MRRAPLALFILVLGALSMQAQDDAGRLKATASNPPATGMMVTVVVPESQAAKAGLKPGDVLTSYDGTPTPTLDEVEREQRRAQLFEQELEQLRQEADIQDNWGMEMVPRQM